ncbi:MAG: hypothetical protein ACOY0T_02205 [Myxococcota bacterium]
MWSVSRWVCLSCAVSLGVPVSVVACKSDKPAETSGYQQGQTGYPAAGYPGAGYPGQVGTQPGVGGAYGAPGGYGQPTPTTTATTPLPPGGVAGAPGTVPTTVPTVGTPTGGAPGGAGGSAQALDAAAATVVAPVLNELAKAQTVAGSKAVGAALVGNFQTGQTLQGQIQLQPNKCYTVVATALPPVTELNVQLLAATVIPNLNPVLATDSDTGPTAVLGRKPNCYKWAFPLPAPAKVVIQVAAGAGLAAAQIYEK